MPLAATLSALRTLILDCPSLPESESDRLALYRNLFSKLTEQEARDLAKISPSRLAIYTDSIFCGEGALLRTRLPLLWSLLDSIWVGEFAQSLRAKDLAMRVHQHYSWKSARTEDLVENTIKFIQNDLSVKSISKAFLLQVADFDLHCFYARRILDQNPRTQSQLRREDLPSYTVQELLALECHLPDYLRLAHYDFDMIEVWRSFGREKSIPLNPIETPCWLAGSRDSHNQLCWKHLPRVVYDFLSEQQNAGRNHFTVASLAEAFIQTISAASDETESFTQFLLFFVELIEFGVISCSSQSNQHQTAPVAA